MNVLVVTSEYPRSGAPHRASFNRQHLDALARLHEVTLVCPVPLPDYVRSRDKKNDFDRPQNVSARIDTHYLPYVYPPGILRGTYDACMWHSLRGRLLRIAEHVRPDVVLGIWAFPDGAVALRLARYLGARVVVQVLGSDINLLDKFPEKRRKTVATLAAADHVISVSQALRRAVSHLGVPEEQISVVYRGVDATLFYPRNQVQARKALGIDPDLRHILFIGNLVTVKNPILLMEAFKKLESREPTVLHVIGLGSLRGALQDSASSLPEHKRVCFHGSVEHGSIPLWMAAADLLVLSSDAEGVPNVLLEARAIGCPYVATRVGGVPEISEHATCRVVEPNDADAMSIAMAELLATPQPGAALSWHSWSDAGRAMADVLEKVTYA